MTVPHSANQSLRLSLRRTKAQFASLWSQEENALQVKTDKGSTLRVWPVVQIESGHILYCGPKKTIDLDVSSPTSSIQEIDGVCWCWRKNDTWTGRFLESSFEWYAENGAFLPKDLTRETMTPSPAAKNLSLDFTASATPARRREEPEMRELLEPVFKRAGNNAPDLRKNIGKVIRQNNPELVLRDAEKALADIQKKSGTQRMLLISLPLLLGILYLGWQHLGNRLTDQQKFVGSSVQIGQQQATVAKDGYSCLDTALSTPTDRCATDQKCAGEAIGVILVSCLDTLGRRDAQKVVSFCDKLKSGDVQRQICAEKDSANTALCASMNGLTSPLNMVCTR